MLLTAMSAMPPSARTRRPPVRRCAASAADAEWSGQRQRAGAVADDGQTILLDPPAGRAANAAAPFARTGKVDLIFLTDEGSRRAELMQFQVGRPHPAHGDRRAHEVPTVESLGRT